VHPVLGERGLQLRDLKRLLLGDIRGGAELRRVRLLDLLAPMLGLGELMVQLGPVVRQRGLGLLPPACLFLAAPHRGLNLLHGVLALLPERG
jgi:hypothetical protein